MTLEDYLAENNVHSDASTSSEMEEEHDTCDR